MIFGLRCPFSSPDEWLWSQGKCNVKPAAAAADSRRAQPRLGRGGEYTVLWFTETKLAYITHPALWKKNSVYHFLKNSNTHLWGVSEFPRNEKKSILHFFCSAPHTDCELKQAVLKIQMGCAALCLQSVAPSVWSVQPSRGYSREPKLHGCKQRAKLRASYGSFNQLFVSCLTATVFYDPNWPCGQPHD